MGTIQEVKKELDDALKMESMVLGKLKEKGKNLDEINIGDLLKDAEKKAFSPERDAVIVRAGVIGILANGFLAAFKAIIGLLSNSIAIVLDAVNNLTDAASSLITIIGTKLAAKAPTREHPFGHGRVEYLTAMSIAVIVLYAGVASLVESVKQIINPEVPNYETVSLIILAVGVIIKIAVGRYIKSVGEKVKSDSLIDSGEDSTLDAVISISTLVAALIYVMTGISLESWLGAIISLVIIKAGIDMLRDTYSKVLGERADAALARDIKNTVQTFEDVSGVYDLVLNNYGPDNYIGSLHVEIPDTYTAEQIDELIRKITLAVYKNHNVILTAISICAVNTEDNNAAHMRDAIAKLVTENEYLIKMHGFYVDEVRKIMRFDVVVSFDAPNRQQVKKDIRQKVNELYPDYILAVALDTDFSES